MKRKKLIIMLICIGVFTAAFISVGIAGLNKNNSETGEEKKNVYSIVFSGVSNGWRKNVKRQSERLSIWNSRENVRYTDIQNFSQEMDIYMESDAKILCFGDSMTQGVGTGVGYHFMDGEIRLLDDHAYPDFLHEFTGIITYNLGISGETSDEICERAKMYYEEEGWTPNDILILELGSNGGWGSYGQLIKQYQDIIGLAGNERYIIVGDTDDPGTSIADIGTGETDEYGRYYVIGNPTPWEQALCEAFGEHFINMREYIIANGIKDNYLEEDEKDKENRLRGVISEKLRYDWTHFNVYGYYSQAMGIYKKGVSLGYWQ